MTDHPPLGLVDVYAATIPTLDFRPSVHVLRGDRAADERRIAQAQGLPGRTGRLRRGRARVGPAFTGLAFLARSGARRLQPFQAAQESLDAGRVPFAAKCGWYLSLDQLACDGINGDKASGLNLGYCRGQRLSSHVSGTLLCLSVVDPRVVAPRDQAQARQYSRYRGPMPSTAKGSQYPSSIQLIRQR